MDNDDQLVGRLLDRRDAVRLLALTGAGLLVGCNRGTAGADSAAAVAAGDASAGGGAALPACLVKPELTVGPYFLDRQLERVDIRAEPTTGQLREGAPLALTFRVSRVDAGKCAPLANAMVDVWHCDAAGIYSGVTDEQEGFRTVGQKFLRGYQVTGADGVARFTTIYPGWYPGRTVHIHFKIRTPADVALAENAPNRAPKTSSVYEFTSQLFFDEATTDRVFAQAPYAAKGQRDTTNAADDIYREQGRQLLLAVAPSGQGYAATFDIGLDLSDAAKGRADAMGPPPGGRPPGPPPKG